jgi:hypothetical protein
VLSGLQWPTIVINSNDRDVASRRAHQLHGDWMDKRRRHRDTQNHNKPRQNEA